MSMPVLLYSPAGYFPAVVDFCCQGACVMEKTYYLSSAST